MPNPGVKSVEVAQDSGFISHQDLTVGQDTQGHNLTHYVIAERLIQVEYYRIMQDEREQLTSETLIHILESGFRGFHNMSPGELWSEWQDAETLFYTLYDDGALPWTIVEQDPLAKQ